MDVSTLKLGYNKCSNSAYHGDTSAYSSTAWKMAYKDLKQFHTEYVLRIKEEQGYKGAFVEGSLTHSYILEPHLLSTEYNFVPTWDRRAKEYKQIVSALPATDKRTLVTMTEKNRVERMVAAYKAHPVASEYFSGGEAEVTIVGIVNLDTCEVSFDKADEGPNTVRVKVRLDYLKLSANFASDVKTTGYGSDLETFKDTCAHWMYEISVALYLLVAEAHFKTQLDFYFGVLSKKEFTCDIYKASRKMRADGLNKLKIAFGKFKAARQSGIWLDNTVSNSPAARAELATYEVLEV